MNSVGLIERWAGSEFSKQNGRALFPSLDARAALDSRLRSTLRAPKTGVDEAGKPVGLDKEGIPYATTWTLKATGWGGQVASVEKNDAGIIKSAEYTPLLGAAKRGSTVFRIYTGTGVTPSGARTELSTTTIREGGVSRAVGPQDMEDGDEVTVGALESTQLWASPDAADEQGSYGVQFVAKEFVIYKKAYVVVDTGAVEMPSYLESAEDAAATVEVDTWLSSGAGGAAAAEMEKPAAVAAVKRSKFSAAAASTAAAAEIV